MTTETIRTPALTNSAILSGVTSRGFFILRGMNAGPVDYTDIFMFARTKKDLSLDTDGEPLGGYDLGELEDLVGTRFLNRIKPGHIVRVNLAVV